MQKGVAICAGKAKGALRSSFGAQKTNGKFLRSFEAKFSWGVVSSIIDVTLRDQLR